MLDDDDFIYNNTLSSNRLLELVDEYTLYAHYLQFDPDINTAYNSFIREKKLDTRASFSIFESKKADRDYMWKDSGLGRSGDVFALIRIILNLPTIRAVWLQIDADFKLGFGSGEPITTKIVLRDKPPAKDPFIIEVSSQKFHNYDEIYWGAYFTTQETRALFNCTSVKCYWMYEEHTSKRDPVYPYGLCYAYRIASEYQLYQPNNAKRKFRQSYKEDYVLGFEQLQYKSKVLIITKAMKDIMVLFEMGYEAVAPRSENTPIPEDYFHHFNEHYEHIVVLFDNDMKHRGDTYPYPKVYVPLESNQKDISDYIKAYGPMLTKKLLEKLCKY